MRFARPLANVSCRTGNGLPLANVMLTLAGTDFLMRTHCIII